MKKENEQLILKKATLSAWAKILLKNGTINNTKYNSMIAGIKKLTA